MPGKRPPCLSEAPCLSPDRETEESGRHIKGGIATKRHTRQTFIESGALLRGVPRLFVVFETISASEVAGTGFSVWTSAVHNRLFTIGNFGKKEKEASSDFTAISKKGEKTDGIQEMILPGWVIQDILPVNEYSRPGTKLQGVNGIVVHYTGNPNTTAEQNRNYYGQLAQTHETKVSSHFVIGMDGKIIQCVPLDEVAYCSNDRNGDTISIECCHKDKGGQFSDETLESLTRLLDWLVKTYDLQREQILRHYEVTGKECPKYYVEHPDEWERVLDGISFLQREEEKDGQ